MPTSCTATSWRREGSSRSRSLAPEPAHAHGRPDDGADPGGGGSPGDLGLPAARGRLGDRRSPERGLFVLARSVPGGGLRGHRLAGARAGPRRAVRHSRAAPPGPHHPVAGDWLCGAYPVHRPLRGHRDLHRRLHALDRPLRVGAGDPARGALPGAHLRGLREVVPGPHAQGPARGLARVLTVGWENLLLGFQVALQPNNLALAVLGITLGTIIGVLPGLGGANGVAILLPLTFSMNPTSAIILLTSLYWGALFGGAITSILFNIPGEPWSVATTFDGYPMARQGKGGQALTAAFTSSFVGALFAVVLITLFAPLLAEVALKFGPPEFFAIQLLTFSSFIGLGGGNPLKSLVSILLGFIMAADGLQIVTGQLRMTFGITVLMKGFDFIVAVIGLFGIGEILLSMEEGLAFRGVSARINPRVVWATWKELPRYWRTFVRSCFIGFWMGFKPGGATPASFMSYAFAKRFSKHPQRFGKGEIEGVVAPETAAHAAGGRPP